MVVCVCVPGIHSLQVWYQDTEVPKSPLSVTVCEGCDPSRVKATGPGLSQAVSNRPNHFNILTRYYYTLTRYCYTLTR